MNAAPLPENVSGNTASKRQGIVLRLAGRRKPSRRSGPFQAKRRVLAVERGGTDEPGGHAAAHGLAERLLTTRDPVRMGETKDNWHPWDTAPKDGPAIHVEFPDGTPALARWDADTSPDARWKALGQHRPLA